MIILRLCSSTLRKGSAFPCANFNYWGYAYGRPSLILD